MNISNFSHVALAIFVQLIIGFFSGNFWIGAAFGAAFYIGREVDQAEYRWIKTFGEGKRANMPWWGGFDPKVWGSSEKDAWLDWLLPTIGVIVVALVL